MARKSRPGRKVYYPRWSHKSSVQRLPRKEMLSELNGRARILTEASIAARQRREAALHEPVMRVFGLVRDGDNGPRQEALDKLQGLLDLNSMDKHIVLRKGIKTVRIMFWSSKLDRNGQGRPDKFWIVERNMFTGEIKRSIDYDSREAAMQVSECDRVTFVRT